MTWPDDYINAVGIEPYHVEPAGVIWCADCRDILPHLPKVDLVLTDPPYGVGKAKWDDVFPNKEIWTNIKSCMKNGSSIVIFPGEADAPAKIALLNSVFDYQWLWVWYKPNAMQFGKTGFSVQNLAWWFSVGNPIVKPKIRDVIIEPINPSENNFGHPSPKPLGCIKPLVNSLSINKNIILDPFLGSGTTAVAAKELGRKFIGIEISREYASIAVKRLKQCNVLPFSDEHNIKKGHGDMQNPMLNLMTLETEGD